MKYFFLYSLKQNELETKRDTFFSRDIHNKLIIFFNESYEFQRTSGLKKYQITRYLLFVFIEPNKNKSLFATLMNVNNQLLLDIFINTYQRNDKKKSVEINQSLIVWFERNVQFCVSQFEIENIRPRCLYPLRFVCNKWHFDPLIRACY